MIDYLKSPFFSPFCGPSVGQGQLISLIISPSSLSLHTETLYLTSPVKFHTDLHLLSLLPDSLTYQKTICPLYPITAFDLYCIVLDCYHNDIIPDFLRGQHINPIDYKQHQYDIRHQCPYWKGI